MTTPETLRAAAVAIQRDGWTRFIRHDLDGRVCALGAIERAFGYHNSKHDAEDLAPAALQALADVIGSHRGKWWFAASDIAEWNNADDQTAENVAQAFELAAVLVEAAQAHEAPASTNAVDPSADVLERVATRV